MERETSSFGYWVRRRRLALDLTQDALAKRVGCATVTIKKIEYDERRPSRQMAALLADALALPDEEHARFVAIAVGERPPHTLPLDAGPLIESGSIPRDLLLAEAPSLVGREGELDLLLAHAARAAGGEGGVVLVSGEAGRGKTALLRGFAAAAQERHPELVVARGYCTAVAGLGDPYLPFRDILLALTGNLESTGRSGPLLPDEARRLMEFAPVVARAIDQFGPRLINTLVPALEVRRWLPDSTAGEPGEGRDQHPVNHQVTAVLGAVAHQSPLLLLIDDLQWADAASIGLLYHLGRNLAGCRILLVGAFRPSEVAGDGAGRDSPLGRALLELRRIYGEIVLNLEQFEVAGARRLTDALLDQEPNALPEPFRVRLFRRTRGLPLFVVELLREMKVRGHLVRAEDGRWVEGERRDWDALPSRVSAVIEQRLSRVSATERRLLEAASVEGERFTGAVVEEVTGVPDAAGSLADLGRRTGLVRELGALRAGGRLLARYQFSHVMFQEYLYEAMGESRRWGLHGRIAAALESLHSDKPTPAAAQLAHHFTAAGETGKAIEYLLLAGDLAHTAYAHREAAEHYIRAVQLLKSHGETEQVAHTLMKLGLTYQNAFDYERAQRAFDESFELWPHVASSTADGRPIPVPHPARAATAAPHPLRLIWHDPASLDPTLGGYNLTAPLATQLFSGLVDFGIQSEIVPDVAERWEIQEDGRRYVFYLRDDVFWSDGAPLTAHDFVFTYRRALDPATQARVAGQLLYPLRGARAFHSGEHDDPARVGVRADDDLTLVLELESPTSYFIHDLAYYVSKPVPRHVVIRSGGDWATTRHIVTSGPFRVAAWDPGSRMRLERNPGFHGRFTGNIDSVELLLGRGAGAHADLYERNEVDVVSTWFAPLEQIDRLRSRYPNEYESRTSFTTTYFWFDLSRAPFDDLRLRRALAHAVDPRTLAEVDLRGYVFEAVGGLVPPGMPGHAPGVRPAYDPALARRLLAEAGYPGGQGFPDLFLAASYFSRSVAGHVAAAWERVLGLSVKVAEMASQEEWEAQRERMHPLVTLGGWWADYPDPDTYLRVDVGLSLPEWHHEEYRGILDRVSRIADQEERLRLYLRAQEILAEEAPLVPLLHTPLHLMLKPWVRRYPTTMVKYPGFWKDVIIEPH